MSCWRRDCVAINFTVIMYFACPLGNAPDFALAGSSSRNKVQGARCKVQDSAPPSRLHRGIRGWQITYNLEQKWTINLKLLDYCLIICKYYKNKALFISPYGDKVFCPSFPKPVWVVLKKYF
jgi:hypothetical protein